MFFSRFLPLSPTTNFIPPFIHTHLIYFVHFINPSDGATGLVDWHPCYLLTSNISHPATRSCIGHELRFISCFWYCSPIGYETFTRNGNPSTVADVPHICDKKWSYIYSTTAPENHGGWIGCCHWLVDGRTGSHVISVTLCLNLNFSFRNRISLLLTSSSYPTVITRLRASRSRPLIPKMSRV